MHLTDYECKILATLATEGVFTTSDIARRVEPMFGNKRMHSHAIRSWLLGLQKRGLVRTFLDDQKPVCWVKA